MSKDTDIMFFPDTTLSRNYHIKGNELYLDTNEVELDADKGTIMKEKDTI